MTQTMEKAPKPIAALWVRGQMKGDIHGKRRQKAEILLFQAPEYWMGCSKALRSLAYQSIEKSSPTGEWS